MSERASPSRRSSTQDAADVAVERVLGGEADAGQHLLAVRGDEAGAAAGDGLGHRGGERRAVVPRRRRAPASAASMATRLSASRWRTAWNAGDRPAELDALEGVARGPARASRATRRPARGRAPAARRRPRRPTSAGAASARRSAVPVDLDQAERGIEARDARGGRGRRSTTWTTVVGATTARADGDGSRGEAAHVERAVALAGGPTAERRQHDAVAASIRAPSAVASTTSSARRRGRRRALQLEQRRRPPRAGRAPGRRASPSSARAASSVGARRRRRGAPRCPWRRARAPRRPSSVGPEVEQAAGDDVALDLGAAAVDRGGAGVEVARTATRSLPASSPSGTCVGQAVGGEVEHRLLGGGEEDLVDRRLGAERARPRASRCCVARERARKAYSCWNASPTSAGRRARRAPPSASSCSSRRWR